MTSPDRSIEITRLLHSWGDGGEQVQDELLPLVYEELKLLAARAMRSERKEHTLQPTALVHDAYLRLAGNSISWQDRTHFFAVAARAMRRVLIDHAKAKRRQKRGAGAIRVTLDEHHAVNPAQSEDMIDLDSALVRLAAQDPRKAQAVELHFFGGLSYEDVARFQNVSRPTVQRDLRLARAWLARELSGKSNVSDKSVQSDQSDKSDEQADSAEPTDPVESAR